MSYWLTKITY